MTTQQFDFSDIRQHLTLGNLMAAFPSQQYPEIWPNQEAGLQDIARLIQQGQQVIILELPTGSGKTAMYYTVMKAAANAGLGPIFYIVHSKTLVDQVKALHPDVTIIYGRNEYDCYYPEYADQQPLPRADEIPCSLLVDCPSRVNLETGETHEPGAIPCPYLMQKYTAIRSEMTACTDAFYLFDRLFARKWESPVVLVIDEAHKIADQIRSALSYEITDYHLRRAIALLRTRVSDANAEADILQEFYNHMIGIIRRRQAKTRTLLEDEEIRILMADLSRIDSDALMEKIQNAVRRGDIDVVNDRLVLVRLVQLVYNLTRYLHNFEYALPNPTGARPRGALNYTVAYYEEEVKSGERTQYKLIIQAYYVVGIVRKIMSHGLNIAGSATIGDPSIFNVETGIQGAFRSYPSDFPADNTRIFMPTDTPNLAYNQRDAKTKQVRTRDRRQPAMILRRIAQACRTFADAGHRSLVLVVSERERERFLRMCADEKVNVISYGDGLSPKDASLAFRNGQGDVLCGTGAHYTEGVDYPGKIAEVTFILRPAYPPPNEPVTLFEERRFGSLRWKVWMWREIIRVQQGRGRNVRSKIDKGVTFLISQQFRRYAFGSLSTELQASYVGNKTFDECIQEAEELLVKN